VLTVLEDMVPRMTFVPERDEVTGEGRKNYKMRSLLICTPHQIPFG